MENKNKRPTVPKYHKFSRIYLPNLSIPSAKVLDFNGKKLLWPNVIECEGSKDAA